MQNTQEHTQNQDAQYADALATLAERLPDEDVLWTGGQSVRHSLRWVVAILLLGAAAFFFARAWDGRAEEILARMEEAPMLLRGITAWLLGHVYMVYLVAAASVLFAICIIAAALRMFYAITDRSLVMMSKGGKGLFVAFALNNIDRIEAQNVRANGVGDLSLRFIAPVEQGRMRRSGCTLNGVRDVEALGEFLQAHVDGLPPEDLPQESLRD